MLKQGEAVFAKVSGAGLVEMRKGPGQWQGHSSGISIPIGSLGGRSVRYRVGASRGHYVQGAPHPQAIDSGDMFVTNQRIVFVGRAKTLECRFDKLVALQQGTGEISVSVSNRQKPTVLHYGSKLDGWMEMRLSLALSIFHGKADEFARSVEESLQKLELERPKPPAPLTA